METFIFSVNIQQTRDLGDSVSPTEITLYSYELGNYLSIFSGKYLSSYASSTLKDVGIGYSYRSLEGDSFALSFDDNGKDINYDSVIYDYHS